MREYYSSAWRKVEAAALVKASLQLWLWAILDLVQALSISLDVNSNCISRL